MRHRYITYNYKYDFDMNKIFLYNKFEAFECVSSVELL